MEYRRDIHSLLYFCILEIMLILQTRSRPNKAITHIQNTAPGPPKAIAVATPAILPIPTLPDKAKQNA